MYFSIKEKSLHSIYNLLTHIAVFSINIIARFNKKLMLGTKGRATSFDTLKSQLSKHDKTIWFHCASLGEYEQGLPVFQEIKQQYPNHKIVLSFFSPSGYEIRKHTSIADVVVYLPLDTKQNASTLLDLVHPELVVFVKYDIWPNYLNELKKRNIRSFLISALFRKEQRFFKFYGAWMRKSLHAFEHIFVQDANSKILLKSINYTNVTISGDTRFDRVYNQLKTDNTLDFINNFKQNKLCVVAGSTWPEDDTLLINYINASNEDIKFIIAPHNIKTNQIQQLQQALHKKAVLYSQKDISNLPKSQVFIIDTIGILSKIYSEADIAYVGGALGTTGLHNTLEPAVFGIPIIIGNHYKKFPEAIQMIHNGGLYAISNQNEFNTIFNTLVKNEALRLSSGKTNSDYISNNRGAVKSIIKHLFK